MRPSPPGDSPDFFPVPQGSFYQLGPTGIRGGGGLPHHLPPPPCTPAVSSTFTSQSARLLPLRCVGLVSGVEGIGAFPRSRNVITCRRRDVGTLCLRNQRSDGVLYHHMKSRIIEHYICEEMWSTLGIW